MKKTKSKNYVLGALILSIGSLISKFLGIFFKIPITNALGDYGMGLYGYAYPLYVTFLTVSTAGLPSAVSKMVSESVSKGNYKQAYRIFWIAFGTLATLGAASSLIMYFSAEWFITTFAWDPGSYQSIVAISIAPFFVCLISVVRGFFQGMQNMVFTGISEILEQIGRVVIGVYLAIYWLDTKGIEWAAAGATFGAVAGALIAFVFLYTAFFIYKNRNRQDVLLQPEEIVPSASKDLFRSLILIALPIAFSSVVSTMMDLINSATIPLCLEKIGYAQELITDLYGQLTSKAQTLVNVPLVLGASLAVSLVPAISESVAKNDTEMAKSKVTLAVKLSFLIALPCAFGLSILAEPIIRLLFVNSQTGFDILRWHAFTVVFTIAMTVLQGILQGAGKYYAPLFNMIIGGLVKLVFNLILVRIPALNIYGSVTSTIIATFVIFMLNLRAVKKSIGYGKLILPIFKIVVSTLVMSAGCILSYGLLLKFMSFKIAVLIAIAISVVIYAGMVLVTKAITPEDIKSVRS